MTWGFWIGDWGNCIASGGWDSKLRLFEVNYSI